MISKKGKSIPYQPNNLTDFMRVAHVLRKLDPSQWGGTEMAIQRLFEGLRRQQVGNVIYCPQIDDLAAPDPLVHSGYQVERFRAFVPILGISDERRRQLVSVGGNLMSFDLLGSLRRAGDLDLIHTHTLGRIGAIARTVAKSRGIPFVVSIHGGVFDLPQKVKDSFNQPGEAGWEWGKIFGLLFSSHHLFRDSSAIIACNEREAALVRERFPDKLVFAQGHGVPVEVYQQDQRASALSDFPQLSGKRVLLCLGRVDPVKNQGWLIEQTPQILAHHPGAMLVLAGACTDEPYGQELHRRVRELGLEEHVLWTGGLAPDTPALVGLLQLADVVLLPSVSETFGLVILEAWAAGSAVLSSRTSGGCTHIRQGENGWLFDLDTPGSFHSALGEALSNPAKRAGMTRLGTEHVKARYGIDALAGRMKEIYEQTLRQHSCAM